MSMCASAAVNHASEPADVVRRHRRLQYFFHCRTEGFFTQLSRDDQFTSSPSVGQICGVWTRGNPSG